MQGEICSRVFKSAVLAWNIDQSQINMDSSMDTISQWDSLGHLKLVMALEKEFGITFRPKDTVRMQSIDKICQIIQASQGD